ncbi:hypothetical protein ACFX1S_003256 [Malus domestica]
MNLDANQNQYVNDLCTGRFTQWKSDLHKHYEKYDGSEVALAVDCPIELVDRRDEWEWLCGHFQDEKYLADSINRSKKKLLHRSGSRRFSYRLEERREIMTDTLDQTLSRRHGNVHRGLGKASLGDPSASSFRQRTKEVKLLTFEVADLKE